jgi:NADH dehydrogenase [ubiquinone] 1 alpha subcomplex assembly factor 6
MCSSVPPTLSPCGETVRRHDPDRFLTSLFAPSERREDLWALYAFHYEIAKTRETVSDPTLGLIRLQWWRESLEGAYKGAPAHHETGQPLADAIARHHLPRPLLERLIDAREADLDDEPPGDLDCLIHYAEATGAPLTQLACHILGGTDPTVQAAARLAGTGVALAGVLRATVFLARGQRSRLPEGLMQRHGATRQALYAFTLEPGLARAVEDVAGAAVQRLDEARNLMAQAPRTIGKASIAAFLPAWLARHDLARLARQGHDPLHAAWLHPSLRRTVGLMLAGLRRSY